MTTITINERTKAGKAILELAKILSESSKGIAIEKGLKKPSVTAKSTYNPRFVAMVKKAQKSTKRTVINPNDIWGSLGLK